MASMIALDRRSSLAGRERTYLQRYANEILAVVVIGLAVGVRLALAALGWPLVNADEGTIAIAARHIAYDGAHPIYFYGYDYMGLIQAYLGAALFHLFGPTLFTLRLGLALLYALFMLAMYAVTRMLFTKPVALLTLAVLALGSSFDLRYQLHAYGGYPEMLWLSAMLFLLALALAFTAPPAPRRPIAPASRGAPGSGRAGRSSPSQGRGGARGALGQRWLRLPLYFCWGVAAGLGIWSHALIMPSLVMSGLLILCFCWREAVWVLPPLSAVGGLLLGLFPVLYYNVHDAAPGRDYVHVVLSMVMGEHRAQPTLGYAARQVEGTLLISVPTVSGNPFCPMSEVGALMEPNSARTPLCLTVDGLWSLGYLSLFALACVATVWLLWRTVKRGRADVANTDARQGATIWRHAQFRRRCHAIAGAWGAGGRDEARTPAIRSAGRLGLLLVGLLTLATYARSDAPVEWPANHARYLLPLLLATPCLVWALWRGMGTFEGIALPPALARLARLPQKTRCLLCSGVLAISMALLGTGTVLTFGEVPFVQRENHQNMYLIAYLEQHGVKHIYTGYWDCDSLAFLSEERVQCAVVGPSLAFSHNRYKPYLTATVADPYAAYIFRSGSAYENPVGSERALPVEEKLREQGMGYQHVIVDGFIVYLPGPTPGHPGAGR